MKHTTDVPEGLLGRCLDTIPATATRNPVTPRLFPDAASRKRLGWLCVAAAAPAITVLAVLPMKHWMASQLFEMSLPHREDTRVPRLVLYTRIESWGRVAGKGRVNPPTYSVAIYDAKKRKKRMDHGFFLSHD